MALSKMHQRVIVAALLAGLFSCRHNARQSPPLRPPVRLPTQAAVTDSVADVREKDTVNLTLPNGYRSVLLLGMLKGIDRKVTIRVPVQKAGQLTAVLTSPDSLANIRFTNVV